MVRTVSGGSPSSHAGTPPAAVAAAAASASAAGGVVSIVDHTVTELNIHDLVFSTDVHSYLGQGSYATVYRGKYQGMPCAVKKVAFSLQA